jgi:glycosyltransferase involved in cell wall biosynthesis
VSPKVAVEFGRALDPAAWQESHRRGEVPSRVPYGLEELQNEGVELRVLPGPWRASRGINSALRAMNKAADLDFSVWLEQGLRRSCDALLCWHEKTAVPAVLRFQGRRHLPILTGVIWSTDLAVRRQHHVRAALRRTAAVWVLSDAQVPVLVRDCGLAPSQVFHLPMGIDTTFWSPAAFPKNRGRIASAGNDQHRDYPTLLAAARRVASQVPDLVLTVASRHVQPGAEDFLVAPGYVPHTVWRERLAEASVVAVALRPNLHASGITTVLEAMASARPVVVTGTPGMSGYVEDGVTGLLVPPGDPVAFALALRELLSDQARAAEMGKAGRRRVEERFSVRHQAACLANIVRQGLRRGA